MIFPWQQSQWQQLIHAQQQKRLPHALLFLGAEGMGKKELAHAFAHTLLCTQSDTQGNPCQTCHACHLLRSGAHPDLVVIEPEQPRQMIKVDQVRDVINFVNETTLKGGFKIIIIHPANSMNINAANALLKTLEEPSANTLFILISHQNFRLPATITSRCQKIIFSQPSHDVALRWLQSQLSDNTFDPNLLLKLAGGAPLQALHLVKNEVMTLRADLYKQLHALSRKQTEPLELAAKWQEADVHIVFNLLLSLLKDMLRFKLTSGSGELINLDFRDEISNLKITTKNFLLYMDQVQKSFSLVLNSINLNRQLLLENIFINWTRYVSC